MHIESFQSCPTLWNFMDCSPSGSSFHSILLASILGWVPCLPLGDLHHRGNKSVSLTFPALAGGFFTTSTTWKPRNQSTTRNLRFFLRQKKTDWNIVYLMYFTYSSDFSHHLQRQSLFSIFGKKGIFECPFLTCLMAR